MTIKDVLPTVKAVRVGNELRALRTDAGLTLAQAAKSVGWDAARLSKVERAKIPCSASDLGKLLDFFGVTGDARLDVESLVEEGRRKAWWKDYADLLSPTAAQYAALEAEASHLYEYQMVVPPGVLQTEEYRRCLLEGSPSNLSDDAVDAYLEMYELRRERLRSEPRLEVHALIGEFARLLDNGGAGVMSRQWEHLVELAALPNITVQVIPCSAGHQGLIQGGVSLLRFPDESDPTFAFVETSFGLLPQESPRMVRRAERLLGRIQQHALPPEQSVELIETWIE